MLAQGAITKTGSTLARRLLVEAAWQYARNPGEGLTLRRRQTATTCCRSRRVPAAGSTASTDACAPAGKPGNVIAVACARELACFLWAAAATD